MCPASLSTADRRQEDNWFGMLKHADVILDSYPFGGYTTTMEAWAVGNAPIVTVPHKVLPLCDACVDSTLLQLMGGRCTAAFYNIMGISDCIANDFAEYVDIAVKLGRASTARCARLTCCRRQQGVARAHLGAH